MVVGLRLFLAADPGDEARHALAALIERRLPPDVPGKVVPPANWHVTLRFVGGVDEAERDRIVHAVDDADLGEAFSVRWGALGAFPRPGRATVLWIGADQGDERLTDLAERVDAAVDDAGFGAEDRPFRAHLTLRRIRPPRDVTTLVAQTEPFGVSSRIESVGLYRSHLGRGGARYELVEQFELGKP